MKVIAIVTIVTLVVLLYATQGIHAEIEDDQAELQRLSENPTHWPSANDTRRGTSAESKRAVAHSYVANDSTRTILCSMSYWRYSNAGAWVPWDFATSQFTNRQIRPGRVDGDQYNEAPFMIWLTCGATKANGQFAAAGWWIFVDDSVVVDNGIRTDLSVWKAVYGTLHTKGQYLPPDIYA